MGNLGIGKEFRWAPVSGNEMVKRIDHQFRYIDCGRYHRDGNAPTEDTGFSYHSRFQANLRTEEKMEERKRN